MVIFAVAAIIIAAYIFAIAPRMLDKPDSTSFTGILYAHRGLFDNETQYPENSLSAFKRALDEGYGIETDVRLTKDGIPVLHHDATLMRSCGAEGNIHDYTYKELQQFRLFKSEQKIPRLSDFLALVQGRMPLIIEYKLEPNEKPDAMCTVVNPLLAEYGATYNGAYCIESFNSWIVRWYKKHEPHVMRGQLGENYLKTGVQMNKGLLFILQNLLINFLTRPDFIAWNYEFRNSISFRLCCSLGALPVAWTIKNQEQLDNAKKIYCAYIFDSFIPKSG